MKFRGEKQLGLVHTKVPWGAGGQPASPPHLPCPRGLLSLASLLLSPHPSLGR